MFIHDDRTWQRVCYAIDGFRSVFGRWPERVRVSYDVFENLQNHFAPDYFQRICSQVNFVLEDGYLAGVAEDSTGEQYDYQKEGVVESTPEPTTYDLFGIPEYREQAEEEALDDLSHPYYLGSSEVTGELISRYFEASINHAVGRIAYAELDMVNVEIGQILSGEISKYRTIPAWHSSGALGMAIISYFNMDREYFKNELLAGIVTEGLAAVSNKINEMIEAFEADEKAEWERDAIPQLNELHKFVVTVVMGSNSVLFPGKYLMSFNWREVT